MELVNRILVALPLLLVYFFMYKYKFIFYIGYLLFVFGALVETTNLKKNKLIILSLVLINSILLYKIYYIQIVFIIGINILSDTFQLTWGKILGQYINYKPFPNISPNKSAIGYIGGVSTVLLINYVIQLFSFYHCLIIVIFGILGDLLLSKIKRNNNIKDYTIRYKGTDITLLGKHGGILDRLDSIILSIIGYYIFTLFS